MSIGFKGVLGYYDIIEVFVIVVFDVFEWYYKVGFFGLVEVVGIEGVVVGE